MLHDDIATETSKPQIARGLKLLDAGVTAKFIMNADFADVKFFLGRAYSDERNAIAHDGPLRPSYPEDRSNQTQELDWKAWYTVMDVMPFDLVHVRTIKKKLDAYRRRNISRPIAEEAIKLVDKLHERWLPIQDLVEGLKPHIVKGRRPNPDAKPSEIRTIDHTGTCACCLRNVKLLDLKIVDHGFKILGYYRAGSCFGVGYPPIEVSPVGAVEFSKELAGQKRLDEEHLANLEAGKVDSVMYGMTLVRRGDKNWPAALAYNISDTKSAIYWFERTIKELDQRAAQWEPALLPDGATHPAMPASDPKP